MDCVIQAKDLQKKYGNFPAVKGIAFCIQRGECFGFLGHNGAGKTSVMRMLCGLAKVDGGELELFGQKITVTPSYIKQRLGIVPQEDNLDTELTVLENLMVYAGYFGMSYEQGRQRGKELLAFMGIEDKQDETVEALSGGMRRRLVIARALLNEPEILVLDEPTTGLDPQARRLVWQKLRLLREQGTTLILTTHYMEEATQLCNRLVIMHEGEILAEGAPEELICRYLLPWVIEYHGPAEDILLRQQAVAELGGQVEEVAGAAYIFCQHGRQVWDRLEEIGIARYSVLLRPSNLEDVFLKLTGRGSQP